MLTAHSINNQPIQAIIFDCDGVLVDTEHLKFLAWQKALTTHNITFSIEEYMPLIGHSSKNILQMIRKNKELEIPDTIIELKNNEYKILQSQGVSPIQDMVNFAFRLFEHKNRLGIKIGLASSAPKKEILRNLQQVGLENVFDLIISGSDDLLEYRDEEGTNKPKPYIYKETSKQLNIVPELCLVFEDTEAGVNAAADAGMITIAVPNQFTQNQDFSKAYSILTSYEELASFKVLQNLTGKYCMPYTIVLTPPINTVTKYISASQIYNQYKPSYLLNANGSSSPHITIVQFDCDSPELAKDVWESLCEKMQEENLEPFVPFFTGTAFIKGTGPYKGTTWIEVSVSKDEEHSPIMKIHYAAIEALKSVGLKPLNASGSNYRPHLTLSRIVLPNQIEETSKNLFEEAGNFKLEFGLSDEKWQYAKTLDIFSFLD